MNFRHVPGRGQGIEFFMHASYRGKKEGETEREKEKQRAKNVGKRQAENDQPTNGW